MTFTVIIPALNEAEQIGRCIDRIRLIAGSTEHTTEHTAEIIVVDGGSDDETIEIARRQGARVFQSAPGRGTQNNVGARAATGDILLFLHADTILPDNAFALMFQLFQQQDAYAATFRLQFDLDRPLLRLYAQFSRFDSIFTRFGDQCIIVRKSFFHGLGGFPEWRIFEDVHFLRSARRATTIHSLPANVITSSRRFLKHGIVRQQLMNASLMLRYLFGATHEELDRVYNERPRRKNTALIIFLRYPRAGKVKTRLGKDIGMQVAADFYHACAKHICREAARLANEPENRVDPLYYLAEKEDAADLREWLQLPGPFFVQHGDDVGERMVNALAATFRKGYERAIVLGTDIPDLSAGIIRESVTQLLHHDLVIGPARDGGYYLIGMKQLYMELFRDIRWSTSDVLSATMNRMRQLQTSVALLPELMDVDTVEEYQQITHAYNSEAASSSVPDLPNVPAPAVSEILTMRIE